MKLKYTYKDRIKELEDAGYFVKIWHQSEKHDTYDNKVTVSVTFHRQQTKEDFELDDY